MYDQWYVDAPGYDPEPRDAEELHPDIEPEPPFVALLTDALVRRAREAARGERQ